MSEPAEYAELAATILRRRPAETRAREVSRDLGIGVVAQAMAERRRRRTVRVALGVSAVVAAAAAAVLSLGFSSADPSARSACGGVGCVGGHVRIEESGGSVSERKLEHGQSVVAGQGRSTIVEFGSGTRITLAEQGELVYREDTAVQRFGLVRGAAHLVVAKLTRGQRFLVDTGDAEVEVRGTVFDVAVRTDSRDCPETTRVSVTEGAVEVRSQGAHLVLHPGQSWESACAAKAAPVEAAKAPAREAKAAAAERPHVLAVAVAPERPAAPERAVAASAEPVPAPAADSPQSLLVEQNDLYAEATAARKAGESGQALALYQRLLERFPRGPLAESADLERIRILKRTDLPRAQADARRHLARFRDGFASAELEALLNGP